MRPSVTTDDRDWKLLISRESQTGNDSQRSFGFSMVQVSRPPHLTNLKYICNVFIFYRLTCVFRKKTAEFPITAVKGFCWKDRATWKKSLMDNKWQPWGFKKIKSTSQTWALGSKDGFLRSAAIIFRQSFQTAIHMSTAIMSKELPPFCRPLNTPASTARSIKEDQLLDSLSDRCLVAGCLSLEPFPCPEGERYDLATALLDSSA